MRSSPLSSGWKARPTTLPWRTATGWPSYLLEHLGRSRILDQRGADEHAGEGPSLQARDLSGASKLSTWLPYPLRRTVMARAPKLF